MDGERSSLFPEHASSSQPSSSSRFSLPPRFFIYLRYFISNRDNLNLNGPLVTFLIGCKEFRAMVQPPRLLPGLKPWTAKRRGQDV